jgi:ribosomal protein L44E
MGGDGRGRKRRARDEDEDEDQARDDEEDAEVQRRLSQRRTDETERMGCAARPARVPLLRDRLTARLWLAVRCTKNSFASQRPSSWSALSTGSVPNFLAPPCAV